MTDLEADNARLMARVKALEGAVRGARRWLERVHNQSPQVAYAVLILSEIVCDDEGDTP